MVMDMRPAYLLFTYPNCEKCASFKQKLSELPLGGEEINLASREGKVKLREYLAFVQRDEKGAIILPFCLILKEKEVLASFTSFEELERWWKSRA